MEISNIYVPSIVSEFTHEVVEHSDGTEVEFFNNDVSLLFHQERLVSKIGVDAANEWIASLRSGGFDSSHNLSDEYLFKFIKSRNIQSLSELQSWSEYLLNQTKLLDESLAPDSVPADDDGTSSPDSGDGSTSTSSE